jgi:nucleotide-binding universal stress UspA family protein
MNLAFKTILVPTDFSPAAGLALEYARMLAQRFGATLHVVYVFEEPLLLGEYFPLDAADVRAELIEARNGELRQAAAHVADVHTETELLFGPIPRRIVESAAARNADLIVMGTHGRNAVARALLGSVAERVVRTADCPVLTVHDFKPAAEDADSRLTGEHAP